MKNKIKGIYMVEFYSGVKIGISTDVNARLRTYFSPWCSEIASIYVISCPYPRIVEQRLKEHFKLNISTSSTEFISNVDIIDIMNVADRYKESKEKYTINTKWNYKKYEYNFKLNKLVEVAFIKKDTFVSQICNQ